MPTTLTDRFIKSVEPPEKGKRIYWDDHRDSPKGFGLRVLASGTKSFVLRYRAKTGTERIQTIGEYPTPWSLTAARLEAAKIRANVDAGADPLQRRREVRQELTVADAVERFCKARVDGMARGDEVRRYFERDLLPVLGRRQLKSVKRSEIIALIEDKAESAPRAAALLLAYTKLLFSYAEDRELIEVSPATGIKPGRISSAMKSVKRGRVLDEAEIRDFWIGADAVGVHRLTALALKLILVTGQRPGEVVGMRWDEVEGETWTIPASRRGKTSTAHSVYLTETARVILEQARAEVARLSERRRWEPSGYVFEHREGKPATTAGLSRALDRYADQLGAKDHPDWGRWHPHDLRRTCRTRLSEIGISEEVAERVIGHTKLGVVGVYNQYKYALEIRAALEAWERRLLAIVNPTTDNVVSFAKVVGAE
ncbi:tyrosine-type recombinase/integrase [Allochromatium vinosum]|uniref:tyrosine-type recombinase/integrase n=1 Tax=Allochromatium vinosum TaxID=1049 RepID=UPI001905D8D2|nr:site-specific integrase [Allochromatium vinosum]MBK1655368.1 integrase [Allochromatium vinosum]